MITQPHAIATIDRDSTVRPDEHTKPRPIMHWIGCFKVFSHHKAQERILVIHARRERNIAALAEQLAGNRHQSRCAKPRSHKQQVVAVRVVANAKKLAAAHDRDQVMTTVHKQPVVRRRRRVGRVRKRVGLARSGAVEWRTFRQRMGSAFAFAREQERVQEVVRVTRKGDQVARVGLAVSSGRSRPPNPPLCPRPHPPFAVCRMLRVRCFCRTVCSRECQTQCRVSSTTMKR